MHKLKRRPQFLRVYKKGRFYKKEGIILCMIENGLVHNRIGISVEKKTVALSTRRNRCKRLLLETYRLTLPQLKSGYDIVLIAKKDLSEFKLASVKNIILNLYIKAHLVT